MTRISQNMESSIEGKIFESTKNF